MRYRVSYEIGITLEDTQTGRSVYFQPGDDAAAFLTHYEPLADACGSHHAAAELWADYAHCAA